MGSTKRWGIRGNGNQNSACRNTRQKKITFHVFRARVATMQQLIFQFLGVQLYVVALRLYILCCMGQFYLPIYAESKTTRVLQRSWYIKKIGASTSLFEFCACIVCSLPLQYNTLLGCLQRERGIGVRWTNSGAQNVVLEVHLIGGPSCHLGRAWRGLQVRFSGARLWRGLALPTQHLKQKKLHF